MADKVLIVDDDLQLRAALVALLGDHYEVIEACSGEEALRIASHEDIRLVLLDLVMPGMSGMETCLRLRRNPRSCHATIVMMSAYSTEADVIEGLRLGADDFLIKPFKMAELKARIDSHLRRQWREMQASPLTGLPGNRQIQQIINTNLRAKVPFAVIHADLNNFKAYNDRYGFTAGDEVLSHTANVLTTAVQEVGNPQLDFVGHIGGDDFVIVTTPEHWQPICEMTVQLFDAQIGLFYDPEDYKQRGIRVEDRSGNIRFFPIMSIALAVVIDETGRFSHPGQIAQVAAEIKKQVKLQDRSYYMVDRRMGS